MKFSISLKNKIILVSALALLGMAVIFYFIILPTVRDIQEINNQILTEKENLEEKFQKGQYLKKIAEDLKAIEPEVEKLKSVYVTKGEEIKFITQLESLSDKYHLDATFPILKEERAFGNGLVGLDIEFHLNGRYPETVAFLTEIESLSYYIDISDVRIGSSGAKDGRVKSVLKGKIYITKNHDNKNK